MPDHNPVIQRTAPVERRVDAIQQALDERGMRATEAVEELKQLAEEQWVPQNGARVVARAWVDPAFRERLLANGRAAVAELGLSMPKHHRHLVVLENTPTWTSAASAECGQSSSLRKRTSYVGSSCDSIACARASGNG